MCLNINSQVHANKSFSTPSVQNTSFEPKAAPDLVWGQVKEQGRLCFGSHEKVRDTMVVSVKQHAELTQLEGRWAAGVR